MSNNFPNGKNNESKRNIKNIVTKVHNGHKCRQMFGHRTETTEIHMKTVRIKEAGLT